MCAQDDRKTRTEAAQGAVIVQLLCKSNFSSSVLKVDLWFSDEVLIKLVDTLFITAQVLPLRSDIF